MEKKLDNDDKFMYKLKLRYSIYSLILFVILSNNISYKILDIIFNKKIEIFNENDQPSYLAIVIMGIIFAIVIFIF